MKENPFDKKLADAVRQSFDDYSEEPSAADLEKLHASLDQVSPAYGLGFLAAGSAFWLRAAAGFALLFSILGILFYIFSETNQGAGELASSEESSAYESPIDGFLDQSEPADVTPLVDDDSFGTLAERVEMEAGESQTAIREGETTGESESEPLADIVSRVNDIHEISSTAEAGATYSDIMAVTDLTEKQDSSRTPDIVFLPASVNVSQITRIDQNRADQLSSAEEEVNGVGLVSLKHTQPSRASLTLGTSTIYTSDGLAGGVGFSAGALRQWSVAPRFRIVAAGLLNFNQFWLSNNDLNEQFAGILRLSGSIDERLEFQTRYTQLALEVPVQAFFDVYEGRRLGNFSVGAGLASRLYMLESEQMEGVRYEGELITNPQNGSFSNQITSSEFSESSQTGAFQHLDTARLLYVSFVYETRTLGRPVSVELFTKHPLGNLTSSEIQFGTTGLTFRYGIW